MENLWSFVFLENCVSCRWTLRISLAWDAYGSYVFLVNGVGRLWNLRISREWRGALMEFTYFLENDAGCFEIYVFLGNGVGFPGIFGISREWRGLPMDFAYFSRMTGAFCNSLWRAVALCGSL